VESRFAVSRRRLSGVIVGLACLPFAAGCVATRSWVDEQMSPLASRVGEVEDGLLGARDDIARLDRAVAGLHLERSLVLDMREGARFGFDSATLTPDTKAEIDRFLREIEERDPSGLRGSSRVFVVAGHTDASGDEGYNYELGRKRASAVAGYLLAARDVDPIALHAVSYGEAKPVADNSNRDGRSRNRRVEILVYGERIAGQR
jgi:outer membrane protein OmpA-like peptidoglycan-associated protein